MAVLFKYQSRKSYPNWNSLRESLLRVQLELCMSVYLFERPTLSKVVGDACAAVSCLS